MQDVHDARMEQMENFYLKYGHLKIPELEASYWELLEELEGEVTDEVEFIEKLLKDKKEYYLQYAIGKAYDLKGAIEAKKDYIKNLQAQTKQLEAQLEKTKEWATFTMTSLNMNKYDCPQGKISFRKSEMVNITDEALIDEKYKVEKVTISADKTRIKADLKLGTVVEGAELVVNQNIQIK